jgi:hypothetical protein
VERNPPSPPLAKGVGGIFEATSSEAIDELRPQHHTSFKERAPSSQQNCTGFLSLARPQAAAFEL